MTVTCSYVTECAQDLLLRVEHTHISATIFMEPNVELFACHTIDPTLWIVVDEGAAFTCIAIISRPRGRTECYTS